MYIKTCEVCQKAFNTNKNTQKYCNSTCSKSSDRYMYKRNNANTEGSISEHLVIIDLLSKGYTVYKAVNGYAPIDLMVFIGNRKLLIEVKTANRRAKNGTLSIAPTSTRNDSLYDFIAAVIKEENMIFYIPRNSDVGII